MRDTLIAIRSIGGKPKEVMPLTVEFKDQASQWLAECLELGTATYAETLEEVRREIRESVTLQLNSVEELGFMDEYLRRHNVALIPLETSHVSKEVAASWTSPEPKSA